MVLAFLLVGLGYSAAKWNVKSSDLMSLWPWQGQGVGLNASIALPAYTEMPPIMLSTAGGERHDKNYIDVPEGSLLSVDVPESDPAPVLEMGSQKIAMSPDDQGRLSVSVPITAGNTITLRHGWHILASWKIRVLRDTPPRITLLDPPISADHKNTRIAFEASDDYGLQTISARVRPMGPTGDPINAEAVVVLDSPRTRHVKEIAVEDLTFLPWAGMPVEIQLEAKDVAGNTTLSDKVAFTLARREFSHPLAKALVEERAKLLSQPDGPTRDEMANIMAGIARETTNYGNDPVVFMALRTGAVRLVLDHGDDVLPEVSRLIWQAAARIEDNMLQKAHDFLRQAQKGG